MIFLRNSRASSGLFVTPNGIPKKTIKPATKYGKKKVNNTVVVRNVHTTIRPQTEDHFSSGDIFLITWNGASNDVRLNSNDTINKLTNINFPTLSSLHAEQGKLIKGVAHNNFLFNQELDIYILIFILYLSNFILVSFGYENVTDGS